MNDIYSQLGLGDGITGSTYDTYSGLITNPLGGSGTLDQTVTPTPASSSGPGFFGSIGNFLSGALNFAGQAVPVATQVNNLVNQNQGRTAQNNTASTTGAFTQLASNPLIWIGAALAGLVVVLLLFRKGD